MNLSEWLRTNDLSEFEPIFTENQVDLKALRVLTDSDLKELGIAFGPRKRILNALATLRGKESSGQTEFLRSIGTQGAGERRQLTVMFCDLVGSTALSTILDPEELHDLIRTYHKTCADLVLRYEGHVAKYLGDGVMAYFGWPIAHEDAAERSVRAALEMVQAVKAIRPADPLFVRIGLATGPVVVGEVMTEGLAESGLVVGETPNLAARLQTLAGAGEVVIASATRRLLGNVFSLTDLGEHTLKGFFRPMQVWRVDAVQQAEGRFGAAHGGSQLAPLFGREQETALLHLRWRQASAGEGQVVLIGGQPGIGKSRLVQELRESIKERHTSLQYHCSPYRLNSPLHPFIQQLEISAGFAVDDTSAQKIEKLETALAKSMSDASEVAPLFAALLSLPTASYPPLQISPQKQKEKTLHALVGRIEALTREHPVLMVVEDVHWIDPTSHELLDLLVPRIRTLPMLLVMTYRLEALPSWTGEAGVTNLTLNRLGWQEGARIVDSITQGKALPPEVLEELLARTDGVPLFVEELTRSLLESGQLRDEGAHLALNGPLASLTIPASLRDLLMARLDRLGPVKELAQIGACIGREFSHELVARIWNGRDQSLENSLETLVSSGLVARRDSPPGAVYTFKHALVQDAAYDSLLRSRRGELHAMIADALENDCAEGAISAPEWLAHHHTQAGHIARAIPLWRDAGMLAVKRVALKEAVAHFQKGLSLIEQLAPSPERDSLELSIREPLNAAWTGLRGWATPEVSVNAKAMLKVAEVQGNRRSLLLAMWWLWTSTITQGRIAESSAWVERLLDEGAEDGDIDLRIFGHAMAMVQHFLSGRLAESRQHADQVLALYDPRHAERWIQLTGHDLRTFVEVYACQLTWMMGFPEQARLQSDEVRTQAYADAHAFNLVWALVFSAYVFAYRREAQEFLERVAEAERVAREHGLAFIYEVAAPQARGIGELLMGRHQEAVPLFRRGIERWTGTGGNVRIPLIKSALAEAVAMNGDAESALQLVDECLDQIDRPDGQERLWLAEVLRRKGAILMRQNRAEEAEVQLRASIDCARRQGAKSWELRSAITLAKLLSSREDRNGARELLAPIYSWFTEGHDTADLIEARTLLEQLTPESGLHPPI